MHAGYPFLPTHPTPDLCSVTLALLPFTITLVCSLLRALGPVIHPVMAFLSPAVQTPAHNPAWHILVSLSCFPQVLYGMQSCDASLDCVCSSLPCSFGPSAKSQHKLLSAYRDAWNLGGPTSPGDIGISSETN